MLLRVFGALLLCLMCGIKETKKLRILDAAVDRASHYQGVSLIAAFTSGHETSVRNCVLAVHHCGLCATCGTLVSMLIL